MMGVCGWGEAASLQAQQGGLYLAGCVEDHAALRHTQGWAGQLQRVLRCPAAGRKLWGDQFLEIH